MVQYGINALITGLIILGTVVLARIFKKIMARKKKFTKINLTQYKFFTNFLTGIIYFFGIILAIYSIPGLRSLLLYIFSGSGILAIIIGFASQQSLSNIVSGIFIAIFRPFEIGDRIRVEGKSFFGEIEEINLRHTIIRTYEYKRIVVPNSVISNEILENENIVDPRIQKFWDIGISYDSDVKKAKAIIREEVLKHPDFLDNRSEEAIRRGEDPVKVRVIGYGDSSVNIRAFVWVRDPLTAFRMSCDLNERVKERFDAEGVEIPFPHRTLVFKDPPKS